MCDFINEVTCEKQKLIWKLEELFSETLTTKTGEVLIRKSKVEALIEELECSI